MFDLILIVILILALVGAIPGAWPHTKDWGKGPITAIFILLMLIIVLALT